jgi:phage antirepressor YoqD-like protein
MPDGSKGERKKRRKTMISKDDPKVQMTKKMSENKSISIGEICATLQISRASYYRYLGL